MRFIQGLFIGYGLVIDKTLASKQSSFRVRPAPLVGLQNTTSEPADDVTVAIHRLMCHHGVSHLFNTVYVSNVFNKMMTKTMLLEVSKPNAVTHTPMPV